MKKLPVSRNFSFHYKILYVLEYSAFAKQPAFHILEKKYSLFNPLPHSAAFDLLNDI